MRPEPLAALLMAALLAGCGLKGDLYLPEDDAAPAAETPVSERDPANDEARPPPGPAR